MSWESFRPLFVPLCWVSYRAPLSVRHLRNKLRFCFVLFSSSNNTLHTTACTHCLRHLLWYLTSKQWHMHPHLQCRCHCCCVFPFFFCVSVVCLRLANKIASAVHSRLRVERLGDHFQRSTWRSINPIQTALRRQHTNNLWRLGNLFMFVTVCWMINNVRGGGSRANKNHKKKLDRNKTKRRNRFCRDKWKAN